MKKKRFALRRGLTTLWAAALCALLLCAGALAAEVSVQLDGEPLTFADAAPEIVDGRTFLPYRAVFTALGAEVSYEEGTRTAVAVRDGITVRVPIGGSQVTVTRQGTDALLEMDVASYVKGGRTYVPVRFMAQALGCVVGWDEGARTVILIDAQKVAERAVAGQSYGLLDRYHAFLAGFQTGNWSVEGELEHRMEEDGTVLTATTASYTGLTAGENRMELRLTMDVDRSAWYEAQAAAQGLTLEQAGVTQEQLTASMEVEMRGDSALGRTYLYVERADGDAGEIPVGTWLSMGSRAEAGGVDLTSLLKVEGDVDAAWVVAQALNELTLTDKDTAMAKAEELAELTAANLSNQGFTKVDGTRVARWTAGDVSCVLTLTLDGEEDVASYELVQTLVEGGSRAESRSAMDSQGNLSVEMTVTGGGQTTVLTQTGRYAAADRAPETAPPAGAQVTAYGG